MPPLFDETPLLPLLSAQHRPLLRLYLRYLQLGWQHFSAARKSATVKQEEIRLLEKAIRRDFSWSANFLAQLQKQFVVANLSPTLLTEPLVAWRYLATATSPLSEAQISEIISLLTAPLSRLLLALNNENPATYLPLQSLLQGRMWHTLIAQKSPLLQGVKFKKAAQKNKIINLIKHAEVVLALVDSRRLKFCLARLFTQSLWLVKNNKQPPYHRLDQCQYFLYSIILFLTVRHRTISRKGI